VKVQVWASTGPRLGASSGVWSDGIIMQPRNVLNSATRVTVAVPSLTAESPHGDRVETSNIRLRRA
jgi:hypothetical protein